MSTNFGYKTLTSPVIYFCRIFKSSQKTGIIFSKNQGFSRQFSTSLSAFKLEKNEIEESPLNYKKLKIGVQGAPFDRGQRKSGVEKGPTAIRNSGFIDTIRDVVGHDIKDYGDIEFNLPPRIKFQPNESKLRNMKEVAKANRLISVSSSKILKEEGRICLTLGGDHSIGIGTVHGASEAYNDLAVLWVDAHSDINTTSTTLSGNMHGMPLAFVIKELQPFMEKIPDFSWVTPRISASNVAFIGLRSVDESERSIIEKFGITAYSMRDVDRLGILEVVTRALDKISPGFKRPLHVSFDIDVLDDLEVSNTGTPVPGGLSVREGMTVMEEIHNAGNLVSLDFVEFNPALGDNETEKRTSTIAKHLLTNAFGYNRGGVAKSPIF